MALLEARGKPLMVIMTRAAIVGGLVALVSSGCISPMQKRNLSRIPYVPEIVRSPPIDTEAEAEIGTSMVATAKRYVSPGIRLSAGINHQGTYNMYPYGLSIPAGPLYQAATDSAGTFFEAPQEIEYRAYTGRVIKVRGGVYVPNASPAATEVYWLATNNESVPLNDDHPGITFQPTTTVERWGEESFKRELVYGGVSQNTITVLYREFMNDMARPAFSQELKYDLSKGDVIGYRGARFQVLNVTNTTIRFKTLKHLD